MAKVLNKGIETVQYRSDRKVFEKFNYDMEVEIVCRDQQLELYATVDKDDTKEDVRMNNFHLTTYSLDVKIIDNGEVKAEAEFLCGISYHSAVKAMKVLEKRNISIEEAEKMYYNRKTVFEKILIKAEIMLETEKLPNRSEFDRIMVSSIRSHLKKTDKVLLQASYKDKAIQIVNKPIVA